MAHRTVGQRFPLHARDASGWGLGGLGDWPADTGAQTYDTLLPSERAEVDSLLVQGVSLANAVAQIFTGRPVERLYRPATAPGLHGVTPFLLAGAALWMLSRPGRRRR